LGLTTIAHLDGYYYKPRVDHELLEQYREGLMISSACLNGEVARAILSGDPDRAEQIIRWYIETFGKENYVLEVQHHPTLPNQAIVNEAVFKYAKQFGLPVIATCDSHYLNREDATAQDVMLCIQTKKTLADTDRMSYIGEDFSLRSPDEMRELWHDHPEVLDSTLAVAEACNVELEFGKTLLPAYALPPEQTPEQELRRICLEGLERRYGSIDVEASVMERLNYELDIIQKTGFAGYFLIVQDFINWAKDHGVVVGPGRGSAPGSLVAYLTRITNIDPIKYNLIFERFLNPERISMPDIDTDFADARRDEVLDYVAQKYGRDHVAQIITFGTMAARASVRDVGRVMGLPYAYCDKISKLIPMFTSLDEAIRTIPELQQINQEPDGKRLLEIARR
jgi:DNA polymerase-3 subunit alpha